MYSSQDLALLPVPHDSVIASFDLCNYQQLPVLDNICFGLEDGDSFVEDGQQQTSEANAATAATAAAAEPSEDLQAPPPPPPKAVQTPPQPQLPLQAPSPQPNVISIEQQLQQHQPLQQLQPLLQQQQQQQPSSTQYVTVLPQHQPQQPMTVIQILVPDDQCSQQQPLIVQAGPPDAPAPVLVSVPVQSVHSSIGPTAALPVAPLRQTLPAASAAAAESLEDVETPVNQMQDLDTDGLDLREFRDLVRAFKEKRVGLGLTQTQAGMDLQAVEGHSYSQSFVCRLERMDVTVRQAKEASRILRKWLEEADHKYCFLNAGGKIVPLCYSKNVPIHAKGPARRQKRTVFPPEALKRLNEYFDVDPSPNVFHTEELAKELEVDAKTIQVWFCNRRQKWKQQQMQRQQ